ncbi:class I SAM-dependent methyltransferase [Pseudomonas solani]|uniref:class I SAM-dependent methyltransferase n=1 Tax=Pseudomonas solani TaxID=2731552 RepID=UPI003F4AD21C
MDDPEILDLFPESKEAANVVKDLETLANKSGLKNKLSHLVVNVISSQNLKSASVIEVCGGSCWLLRAVEDKAKNNGVALSAVGSDFSVQHIENNRSRYTGSGVKWVTADATKLPYKDKQFDVAINCQALHHFAPGTVMQVLREMSRVAEKVIVFDLRRTWYGPIFVKLISPFFSKSFISDGVASHRRSYSIEEVEYLIQTTGVPFRVKRFTPVGMILESFNE